MRRKAFLATIVFGIGAGAAAQFGLPWLAASLALAALACGFAVVEAE